MNGFIKGTLIVAALAGIGAGGHFGYKAINNKIGRASCRERV